MGILAHRPMTLRVFHEADFDRRRVSVLDDMRDLSIFVREHDDEQQDISGESIDGDDECLVRAGKIEQIIEILLCLYPFLMPENAEREDVNDLEC
jgi:hypothetical protein